jgi:cytidylate kinase
MGIITISRGSYSMGKEIAEKLAERLGYKCISREVLLQASDEFDVPVKKLVEAIKEAPSILDRLFEGKQKYIPYIRHALLEHLQEDNVIYHGLAGQFFTKDIPNVLRVRITADIDNRIKILMGRENIAEDEARKIISKIDSERKKWSMAHYGIDTKAHELFDIVLHIDQIDIDGAVDIIYDLAKSPCFQTTPETKSKIKELLKIKTTT